MPDAPTQKPRLTLKDTNPKDSIGIRKPRCYHVLSGHVDRLVSIAMMEGAMKYGAHNYRIAGVRASVYYDATREHLDSYWEGETTDPDSGLPHVIKAIASLYVLADAMLQGKCEDDRPPNFFKLADLKAEYQVVVDKLFEKYPNPVGAYTQREVDSQMSTSKGGYATGHQSHYVPAKSSLEKIAEGLAKGLVPEADPAEDPLPPEHKAENVENPGHVPPTHIVRKPYTPGPRQANTAEAEKGWKLPSDYGQNLPSYASRNPDADMTAGEEKNLAELKEQGIARGHFIDKSAALSKESMDWLEKNDVLPKD